MDGHPRQNPAYRPATEKPRSGGASPWNAALGSSASLIGTNAGFAALPNLTTRAFDLATVNGHPANLTSSEEMQLIDSNGHVIGTPSAPDSDADGFNACTWATSCSAPSGS